MHSATTATGRPLPPPGKTLPKNRPAPSPLAPPRHPAAPKPHITSQLQCYIPAVTDDDSRSPLKINRQPRRLDFAISPTKQTPAPQINRQQMCTSHPALFAGLATSKTTHPIISDRHDQHASPAPTRHSSLNTRYCRSNRHTPRLENAISRRKQTLGTLSNRQFLQPSESHQRRIANADGPPQVASNIVSNRQSQILEITVNLSKQTIAPRSNRHKNAVIKRPKCRQSLAAAGIFWDWQIDFADWAV